MYFIESDSTFQRCMSLPSSELKNKPRTNHNNQTAISLLGLFFDREEGDYMFL
jgi:hypothetical protein